MIDRSAAGRVGTVDEITNIAALLLGPDGSFITGSDLLIDGSVIADMRTGCAALPLRTEVRNPSGDVYFTFTFA